MRVVLLLLILCTVDTVLADSTEVIKSPALDLFSVCYDNTCKTVVTLSVSAIEWAAVTVFLHEPLADAAAERRAIARYIAAMEELIGYKTPTGNDRGGNFRGMLMEGQMDCIDESTNTDTYLRLLEQHGLLRYHRVLERVTRFGIFAGMPHTTAVIEDTSGTRYAVDSWFFDNGIEPAIVELGRWKSGWRPDREQHD